VTQLRLTKADAKNHASILWKKLATFEQCHRTLVECYRQIQQAFDEKHIGVKQFHNLMTKLDAIQENIPGHAHDLEKVRELSHQANSLRCEALNLVKASENAAQGWKQENPPYGPWKRCLPYEIKKY